MEQRTIDSISEADTFAAVEEGIGRWEQVLADRAAAIAEILQLQREIEAIDKEEQAVLTDGSLAENAAAKKLNELRPRRELKQMKLQSLRDRVGLKAPALTQVQVTELEREAAELEESIQASTAEEAQIFRGGGGRGLEVTRRLAELRAERQAKADKLTIIRSQLCSHEDAFRAKPAEAEVRQEVDLVIGELIRRREATASRLLDNLCNPAWRDSGLVWRFRSVQEVSTLRRASYSDPSEAHALLNRLRALSEIEPLAEVLRVCEQKQMSAGEIAEVVQA